MKGCWYKMKKEGGYSSDVSSFPKEQRDSLTPIFDSSNDLTAKDGQWTGSCQWSSVIWCLYAINGYPNVDPRDELTDDLRKLVKHRPTYLGGISRELASEKMIGIARELGMNAEAIDSDETGISQHTEALLEMMYETPGAYLVWMQSHMIAFYKVPNSDEIYFYDNTMGCVKGQNRETITPLVKWACECNGEWRECKWSVVRCTLRFGKQSAFALVKAVKAVELD